jgi:hypothetical protein
MGYTHYWTPPALIKDRDWKAFVSAVSRLVENDKVRGLLAGPLGAGDPIADETSVAFNGRAFDRYESFVLTQTMEDSWGFCKTGRQPYDVAVVATLMLAAHYIPGFVWRSDGDPKDHRRGFELACEAVPLSEWPRFAKSSPATEQPLV